MTLFLLLCLGDSGGATAQVDADSSATLNGKVELARLVDLCAARLDLAIEYDDAVLRGVVTLRLGRALSNDELWALTNRVLAARGFTSVRHDSGDHYSIVRMADAPGLAAPGGIFDGGTRLGFVAQVIQIEHQPIATILQAVKPLLSRQGGAIQDLGADDLVLISDLSTRVEHALEFIERLDRPNPEPIVETIEARYLGASTLSSLVTAAMAARDLLAARKQPGSLSPAPDDRHLVLVAPSDAAVVWREFIDRFDRPQDVVTYTYSPPHFSLADVSGLIEQTARELGPRGSGDRWRLVIDDLTATLVITATPAEHERIEILLDRLATTPAEARRPMRTFTIRNRGVTEVLQVLNDLLDVGVLDAAPPGDDGIGQVGSESPAPLQRSFRNVQASVQPPFAQESVMPASVAARPSAAADDSPGLTFTADEATSTIIAVGDPRMLDQLETLIRQLDQRQPQVMIEVLVVSLTEGDTFDLGVELEKIELSGETIISLSSLFGLGGAGAINGGLPSATGSGFSGVVLSPGDFSVVIRALQTLNDGRSLSMPKVLINNNAQATLDSVLQQPFLSTNASDTVATTSFGGTEDAGTTVTLTPQIAEADHIVLEYALALSTFVGESSDPSLPPPRQQNALQSTVTIPDGHTIVVGGLEIETDADATSKVPLLGDLPGIGPLFSSRSNSRSRSRFYVFIRPSIMRHGGFEDLKYISERDAASTGIDDGWPTVMPRIIR